VNASRTGRWLALASGAFWACVDIPERSPSLAGSGGTSMAGGTAGSGNTGAGATSSGGTDNGAGADGDGGTANSGGTSNAGTTNGGTSGSGGSSGSSAGTSNAGSSGSSGAGGDGGASGSGNCKTTLVALGVNPADALIDDFDDGDGGILPRDGRSGNWFLTTDGTGSTTPQAGPVTPVDGGSDGTKGMFVSGSNVTGWGVDLAAPFVSIVDGCYDASAYTGVRLVAAGNTDPANNSYGTFYLSIFTAGVRAAPEAERNFYKIALDIDYGGIWVIHTVHWGDLAQLGGWGVQVPFDPKEIYAVSVAAEGPDIEFAIDDIEFITD